MYKQWTRQAVSRKGIFLAATQTNQRERRGEGFLARCWSVGSASPYLCDVLLISCFLKGTRFLISGKALFPNTLPVFSDSLPRRCAWSARLKRSTPLPSSPLDLLQLHALWWHDTERSPSPLEMQGSPLPRTRPTPACAGCSEQKPSSSASPSASSTSAVEAYFRLLECEPCPHRNSGERPPPGQRIQAPWGRCALPPRLSFRLVWSGPMRHSQDGRAAVYRHRHLAWWGFRGRFQTQIPGY